MEKSVLESANTPQARRAGVLILYNRPKGGPTLHTQEPENILYLEDALLDAGYRCSSVNVDDDVDRINDAVVVNRPTLVFHLIDHMWSDTALQAAVAGMLDLFGYIYTGSEPSTLVNCQDRARTHVLLREAGLPVSPFAIVRDINAIPDVSALPFPQIATQAFDDIYDEEADRPILHEVAEVQAQCRELAVEFDLPLLCEHLLPGARVSACVLGNRVLEVLPLTETLRTEGKLGVQTAQLDIDTAGRIRDLARRAVAVVGTRDVAQVDFALDGAGQPFIVDVRASVDYFGPVFRHAADEREGGLEGVLVDIAKHCHGRLPANELQVYPLAQP